MQGSCVQGLKWKQEGSVGEDAGLAGPAQAEGLKPEHHGVWGMTSRASFLLQIRKDRAFDYVIVNVMAASTARDQDIC